MRPAQVVDAQAELLSRLARPAVRRAWTAQLTLDHERLEAARQVDAKANAAASIQLLTHAVADAYAFHVTPDLGLLVEHAASQLDDTDRVMRLLAPTRSGIARFERSLPFTDARGKRIGINWLVWGPTLMAFPTADGGTSEPQEATSVWFFNDEFDDPDDFAVLHTERFTAAQRLALAVEMGRWGFIGGEILYDQMRVGPAFVPPSGERSAKILADGDTPAEFTNVVRLVTAFWLLLGQRLVRERDEDLPRAAAKRAVRAGLPPRVTVLELRAYEGARRVGETDVEWSHRWVVRGHPRWQPYGTRAGADHDHTYGPVEVEARQMVRRCVEFGCDAELRRIWIAPFVKGPDGAPLIVSDKVYALRR